MTWQVFCSLSPPFICHKGKKTTSHPYDPFSFFLFPFLSFFSRYCLSFPSARSPVLLGSPVQRDDAKNLQNVVKSTKTENPTQVLLLADHASVARGLLSTAVRMDPCMFHDWWFQTRKSWAERLVQSSDLEELKSAMLLLHDAIKPMVRATHALIFIADT
jgi:hypothetical protein